MNISIGARTDVGGRSNNEDCLAVLDRERVPIRADAVLVIADGMGGRANGEEASGIAVKTVRETLMELLDPSSEQPMPPAEDILAAGMRRANSVVYDLSQDNPDTPGMGTTCIAALVSEGILTLAHVGDSRAYLIRDNCIKPLTADHTYVADQVRAGNMSVDAARKSRFRNVITRAIGIAPTVQPDFDTFPLLDRDTVLFCTDGLTNTLDEEEILEVVRKSDSAQGSANSLVDAAKAAGVRDNVTIITVRVYSDVLSSKLRRGVLPPGSNGTRHDGSHDTEPVKPEKRLQEPPIEPPLQTASPTEQSSGFRLVAVAILSALLGAAVTAGALFEIGWLSPTARLDSGSPIPPTSSSVMPNPATAVYSAPAQVYYKPVRSNFLLVAPDGLLVESELSGAVVHVNFAGQVLGTTSVSQMPTAEVPAAAYYASDSLGDVYVSSPLAGTVTEFSLSKPPRLIASRLVRPGALAVSGSGDVYIIVSGQLMVMHPSTSVGKS